MPKISKKKFFSLKKLKNNHSMFLRMRTLYSGQSYGLHNIAQNVLNVVVDAGRNCTNRFCLVSKECVLIRLSCQDLQKLTGILGINKTHILKEMYFYHSDSQVQDTVEQILKNNDFKRKTIESCVLNMSNKARNKIFTKHMMNIDSDMDLIAGSYVKYNKPKSFVRFGNTIIPKPLSTTEIYNIKKIKQKKCHKIPKKLHPKFNKSHH